MWLSFKVGSPAHHTKHLILVLKGLIIEPLMSVAGTSETGIKHQPLSVCKEVDATRNAPYKEEKICE
jgi:hypothetical protein